MGKAPVDEQQQSQRLKYKCRMCGYQADDYWYGACPIELGGCGRRCDVMWNWGKNEEKNTSFALAQNLKPRIYVQTGITELDKVLGGGLVAGSSVLFGGAPNVGKTTMLMQVANNVASKNRRVIYAAVEQNQEDLMYYANRLGVNNEFIAPIFGEDDVYKIADVAMEKNAKLIIIDSIMTVYCSDVDGRVGSVGQVNAVANYLTSFGKSQKTSIIFVCHVNKEMEFAGSMQLHHLVDTMIFLEACKNDVIPKGVDVVEIISDKNRNGKKNLSAMVELTDPGFKTLSMDLQMKLSGLD